MSIYVWCPDDHNVGTMRCEQCGAKAPFDARLPFVPQTSAFIIGHNCPDGPISPAGEGLGAALALVHYLDDNA